MPRSWVSLLDADADRANFIHTLGIHGAIRWQTGRTPSAVAFAMRPLQYGPALLGALLQPSIRPYPQEYVTNLTTRDGEPVTIRPI